MITAQQIVQLLVTTDTIDTTEAVTENGGEEKITQTSQTGKKPTVDQRVIHLGTGHLNHFKALTETSLSQVSFLERT